MEQTLGSGSDTEPNGLGLLECAGNHPVLQAPRIPDHGAKALNSDGVVGDTCDTPPLVRVPSAEVCPGNAPHATAAVADPSETPRSNVSHVVTLHPGEGEDHACCASPAGEVVPDDNVDTADNPSSVNCCRKSTPTPPPASDCPIEEGNGCPRPSPELPHPPHVMAEVRVQNVQRQERLARGMQDSKSLDEISQVCGRGRGRRATISSSLELEGTVSHDGNLTHFITSNLEDKIKSSRGCPDDQCSQHRRGAAQHRPADIPPIDPSVLLDLQKQTQDVAERVGLMMQSLCKTIQNMTALSVGYIQTYRDCVDSLGESVDMSIKGMYTLMARCEELERSMQPIHTLAAQIRDLKGTLDKLEALCK